jgi:predicted RecB family endonuclease
MTKLRKSTGEMVEFEPEKIAGSLRRCGADEKTVTEILGLVGQSVYDGMYTREIYKLAMRFLRKRDKVTATKYTLKESLMHLGDTGYPFEIFVERFLQREGYETKRNQIVEGECVSHEVDVTAYKNKDTVLVECKHHRREDAMCHIQTALYVYARYLDLKGHFNEVMLVTNTLFSKQAIQYANCRGIRLLGWNYPVNNGLERRIDKYRLYPITMLSIKQSSLQRCIERGIILLEDVAKLSAHQVSDLFEISERKAARFIELAKTLTE